ncbi:MAG: hypothetical protein A2040_11135 [Rhodocyclales bacterium GWA2_65_19]|nr:MAG: hypothetical protein A2040_11135 [Rhodocyclales bacterium GWA2_65_19]
MQDFDFKGIKETRIEPLFEAWLAVPEAQRAKMEVDLREIGDMSNEKGVKAILDEAEFHLSEDGAHETFVAMLMALPGHHERAMTTFLDSPALWRGATRLYHADTLSHWRKRKNLPKKKAAVDPADIKLLEAAIKGYYQHTEGRAKHCRVEPYRRGELEYFFAFPEDHAQNSPEPSAGYLALMAACYFSFATATAIAAARLIPLPCAQSSSRSSTAGSIVTLITLFFPVRLIAFLPSGA